MKRSVLSVIAAFLFIAVLAPDVVTAAPVDVFQDCSSLGGSNNVCANPNANQQVFGNGGIFSRIINTLFIIIGLISVILIVIGGLRYVLSAGDQAAVKNAKNTILYAIVGLVIAILAYAIVNFVVANIV